MNIPAEKLQLMRWLLETEDTMLLRALRSLFETAQSGNINLEEVVGYNPDGTIVTKSDLITRAIASNKAIEEERLTDLDDLEQEMENW